MRPKLNTKSKSQMPLSHEHVGSKILANTKCIPSPEQNYFLIFAMRYPVVEKLG